VEKIVEKLVLYAFLPDLKKEAVERIE